MRPIRPGDGPLLARTLIDMPRFRPLPVLTVFTLASLVLLVTLGGWQMQRMAWKSDLITAYEARGAAVSFREAICSPAEGVFSPPVTGPVPLTGQTLRLYTLRDTAGWMRLALMRAPACAAGEPARSAYSGLGAPGCTRPPDCPSLRLCVPMREESGNNVAAQSVREPARCAELHLPVKPRGASRKGKPPRACATN